MADIVEIIEITAGDEIIEVGDIILTAGYDVKDATLVNVTNYVPLGAGEYYTLTTAITAVPNDMRKTGLCITFSTSSGVWKSYQFKGASTSGWSTEADWELQGVSQAAVDGKEPLLPETPSNPDIKYLNGLRQWAPLAPTHDQTLDKNGNADYLHVTKAAQTFEGVKTFTDSPIVPNLTSGSADGSVVNKKTMVDADALKTDKTATENVEEVTANALVILKNRIDALEELLREGIFGNIQIDNLDIVGLFNIHDGTNMILKGSGAPTVVPDFIGQFYLDFTTPKLYASKGTSTTGDWFLS